MLTCFSRRAVSDAFTCDVLMVGALQRCMNPRLGVVDQLTLRSALFRCDRGASSLLIQRSAMS